MGVAGGGILQEASWRRHHGGGTMDKAPWRRHLGGGILKNVSWRTQEASRRHPEGTQEAPRSIQETPGGTKEARGILEAKCAKTYLFFCQKWRDRVFRVDGSDLTLTIACKNCVILADAPSAQSPQHSTQS